jgi:hypothetical protein
MIVLPAWCSVLEQGGGRVEYGNDAVRLIRPATTERLYSNAQIGDPIGWFPWRPPLTLSLRARFSHPIDEIRGTAGFGFWNAALSPGSRRIHAPRAAWYFAAGPPHDVPLALDVPGRGFKAATLDAHRWTFYALLPSTPLAVFLLRVPALYRALWPIAQRAIGVAETALTGLDATAFHEYTVCWGGNVVSFAIDGVQVLATRLALGGPLSFVAWIDNSFAIATPQGRFGFGLVAAPEPQWLEIADLVISGQVS